MKKLAFKDKRPTSIKMLREQSFTWGIDGEAEFFKKWGEELTRIQEYNKRRGAIDRARNSDSVRESNRRAYAKNREQRVLYAREYRIRRKSNPKVLAAYREYVRTKCREREQIDINFRLGRRIRGRILGALKYGTAKSSKTTLLLGCTIPQLREYIEGHWKPGMTWANHGKGEGKWHIDHRFPCSSFDLTKPSQQRLCFHYTNLQPLWERDNLSKGDKVFQQAELGLAI